MNNNMIIASFKQTYRTPKFESSGIKKLYITKNSEEWKIIGETFSLGDVKKVTASMPWPETRKADSVPTTQVAMLTPQPDFPQESDVKKEQGSETLANPDSDISPLSSTKAEPVSNARQEDQIDTQTVPQIAETVEINPGISTGITAETTKQEDIHTTQNQIPVPKPVQKEQATDIIDVSLTSSNTETFREEIENFIREWIDSWEKKDISRYIAFYETGFSSGGMDLRAWERHKSRLNKQYASIKIKVSNIKVTKVSDDKADITFIQDYSADKYADHGEKNMVIIKKGIEWKIKKEEWKSIRQ